MAGDDLRAGEHAREVAGARPPGRPADAAPAGRRRRRGRCRAAPRPSSPPRRRRCRHSAVRSWIARHSMPRIPSVPLISASPSLARSTTGCSPARASASARRHDRAVGVPHLALADQRQRAMAERGEVAAGAERAVLADDRREARGGAASSCRSTSCRPGARARHRQAAGAQQQHRPHDLALDGVAHAGGVRAHQRQLQLGGALGRDDGVGERAEAGGDAVHRRVGGDELVDQRRRALHLGPGARRQPTPAPRRAPRRRRRRSADRVRRARSLLSSDATVCHTTQHAASPGRHPQGDRSRPEPAARDRRPPRRDAARPSSPARSGSTPAPPCGSCDHSRQPASRRAATTATGSPGPSCCASPATWSRRPRCPGWRRRC